MKEAEVRLYAEGLLVGDMSADAIADAASSTVVVDAAVEAVDLT